MKTKIVLLIAYIAFGALAAAQWRSLNTLVAMKERDIAAWQRLEARQKAGVVQVKEPVPYLRAYQGFAEEAIHRSSGEQQFILWTILLTAPLALHLIMTLRVKKVA